jgi:hypothetical protein
MAMTMHMPAPHPGHFYRFAGPRTRRVLLAAAAFSVVAAAAAALTFGGSDADVANQGGTQSPCAQQTWPYIEARCLKGANREVRHVRETTLASVPSPAPSDVSAQAAPHKKVPHVYSDEIGTSQAKSRRAPARAAVRTDSYSYSYSVVPRGREIW